MRGCLGHPCGPPVCHHCTSARSSCQRARRRCRGLSRVLNEFNTSLKSRWLGQRKAQYCLFAAVRKVTIAGMGWRGLPSIVIIDYRTGCAKAVVTSLSTS